MIIDMKPSDLFEGENSTLKKAFDGTRTFSDFMRNASPEEKRALFLEVAREANEEQRKVIKEASCTNCHCRFAQKIEPNHCECNCHKKI